MIYFVSLTTDYGCLYNFTDIFKFQFSHHTSLYVIFYYCEEATL